MHIRNMILIMIILINIHDFQYSSVISVDFKSSWPNSTSPLNTYYFPSRKLKEGLILIVIVIAGPWIGGLGCLN